MPRGGSPSGIGLTLRAAFVVVPEHPAAQPGARGGDPRCNVAHPAGRHAEAIFASRGRVKPVVNRDLLVDVLELLPSYVDAAGVLLSLLLILALVRRGPLPPRVADLLLGRLEKLGLDLHVFELELPSVTLVQQAGHPGVDVRTIASVIRVRPDLVVERLLSDVPHWRRRDRQGRCLGHAGRRQRRSRRRSRRGNTPTTAVDRVDSTPVARPRCPDAVPDVAVSLPQFPESMPFRLGRFMGLCSHRREKLRK
mmetsp:Transcript_24432/g.63692  ORF Transcript_24432/g.63692 Transcript_24432/m.63692 type:complete len:252 (-) Transcript_24432:315-1070(-)